MTIRWRRREAGSYVTVVNGVRYALVNMKSGGPNSPRWQGPVPAWEVREGGKGEYDIGAKCLTTVWTLAGAKEFVASLVESRN